MGLPEDLDQIDGWIRQLQIEWDKFFSGIERKPPHALKARVEALIRRHANGEIRNNTERFRYQGLTARYNSFNELWQKRLRAIEEGRPIPGFTSAGPAAAAPAPRGRANASTPVRVGRPEEEGEAVRALFDRFVEARQETGEGAAVKFKSFQKLIAQQASRILSEKGARAVDFRIETKGGKVSLKAKAVK